LKNIEEVEGFCYIGSVIATDGSYNKNIKQTLYSTVYMVTPARF